MSPNTRIDFYVLQNRSPNGHLKLTCRIVGKAYKLGHRVYMKTKNLDESLILDDFLWTFAQNSFIPHQLDNHSRNRASPVLIGEQPTPDDTDIVVSLTNEPLSDFNTFSRIAEVVGFEDDDKTSARKRFRYYRELGVEPTTHHITL